MNTADEMRKRMEQREKLADFAEYVVAVLREENKTDNHRLLLIGQYANAKGLTT